MKEITKELEKIARLVEASKDGTKTSVKKTSASDPTVTATVFSREMAQDLNDMMDMLDETGNKYYQLASDVSNADAKLVKLFDSRLTEEDDKREIARIILNTVKNIDLGDSISSTLYDLLSKYGNVKLEGRKSKYSILER